MTYFPEPLNRLRVNKLTEEDKKDMQKHIIQQGSAYYPKNALHLFTENKFVDRYNENFINNTAGNKVTIRCHDTLISADITRGQRKKLVHSLPRETKKTANLPHLVTVAEGMIYDLSVNVNVKDGLTHGSTCIVKHIEYKLYETDRPSIIWVLLDDPHACASIRNKYRQRGFYGTDIDPMLTPVFDIERTLIYNFKTFQRFIQFPLKPSAGRTVYIAQGMTVDELVVDLSQTKIRKELHIHYVALGRVKQ